MPGIITRTLSAQAHKRLSVLATAAEITFRPTAFADDAKADADRGVVAASRYFLTCVGLVLAVEAVFSFTLKTAFSDLVHHSFPVFVALLGAVTMHVFLKLLLTPGIRFSETFTATLYVGGAALLFMITTIFALLSLDFAASYQVVKTSPCAHRTIICLISGGSLSEYDVPGHQTGMLGVSFPFILLVMVGTVVYYTLVLGRALHIGWGVARWRTYIAAALSVVLLTPLSLLTINAIYRYLYA